MNLYDQMNIETKAKRIYEYAFYRMINAVKEEKERLVLIHTSNIGYEHELLKLEDDETRLCDRVADWCYHTLLVETEELVMKLFTLFNVDYIPFEGDEEYSLYMPFYRNENGKRIAYLFSRSMTQSIDWQEIKTKYHVDGIKVIAFVELGDDSDGLDYLMGFVAHKSGSRDFVQYFPIKELFKLISKDEYLAYKEHVDKFNDDVRKLIGYRTIIIPSDSSLKELKAKIEADFVQANFCAQLKKDSVHNTQIRTIENNFWNRRLINAIFGEASFAESFISSEWYYRTHDASSTLEQTAIIAGFLKSVEQLLYSLVRLSIGTGKKIRILHGEEEEYIDYCEENESTIKTSLGTLIKYVKYYQDLWDVSTFVKKYVISKLEYYRDEYRNNLFHKDNIYSTEKIEEIRANTLFLYYLLLGAMKIKDTDKEKIGIVDEPCDQEDSTELTYQMFEEWLERIFEGGVVLPKSAKLFFEVRPLGDKWELSLLTVSGLDNYGFPIDCDYPCLSDELKWDRDRKKEEKDLATVKGETVNKVVSILRRYLKNGKYSDELTEFETVYAGWTGDLDLIVEL